MTQKPEMISGAAWVLWMCGKGGHFEKLSHGGQILQDNTAMAAEREAVRMGGPVSDKKWTTLIS